MKNSRLGLPCNVHSFLFTLLILVPSLGLSEEIFEDFSDGNVTDGSPLDWRLDDPQGSGEIVGSAFRLSGDAAECCSSIYSVIDEYSDISVEIEVEFLSQRNAFSGIGLRNLPNNGGPEGYWAGVLRNGELGIGLDDANSTIVKRGVFLPQEALEDGRITYRVDAEGNEIRLSAWNTGDEIDTATVLTWIDADEMAPWGNGVIAFLNPYGVASNDLDIHSIQIATTPVPEPCGSHLLLFGLSLLAARQRSRHQ